MSYILDALKKSDRERQEETPSHLQHLYETPPPSFKAIGIFEKHRWPWLVLVGLVICGVLVKWSGGNGWINWNRQGPEGEAHMQSTPAPTEMAAQQEPAGQVSALPGPAAAEDGKSLTPLTVQAEWFDDWFEHLPKKDYSAPLAESPAPDEVEREEFAPVVSKTATRSKKTTVPVKIRRDREKIYMVPQDETTVIRQPPPVPPVIGQSQPVMSAIPQPQPVLSVIPPPEPVLSGIGQSRSAPSEKTQSNLPYLHDLSLQVQAEIPKLQFAGHAYALAPSQRLIVINGMIMREGDQIDAETRLAEITWEGVIIHRKGVRFQVKCY